jgi:2-polyprenyl-6-methoxyphenol hydroxylase-like FAD-dependent oxidoreductase
MPTSREQELLIVGAGPTGLAAALFLADRGLRVRLIDKMAAPTTTSRAQVVNPRSLELLEGSGVAAAILREARPVRGVRFYENWRHLTQLDFDDLPSRYAMSVLPQARTEALLANALAARGVAAARPVAFAGLTQFPDRVDVVLSQADGGRERVTTPVLLAADGAHSDVRAALGIGFEGSAFPEAWPLYDIRLNDPLDLDHAHVSFVEGGLVFLLCIEPGLWRVFGNVAAPLDRLPQGTMTGNVEWQSSFHISHRLASRDVIDRVAFAGDAAHIHSPVGARGMNLGIEDAFVFAACAADALAGDMARLDDYAHLRHPVHARVVARMDRLTSLARGRPGWVGHLRHFLIPALTNFGPLAHIMREFITGLDYPTRTA